jgi:hypothetical protein
MVHIGDAYSCSGCHFQLPRSWTAPRYKRLAPRIHNDRVEPTFTERMLILLRVPNRPPQYYEKMSSISSCRTFFVLVRFFCFESSAAVDALVSGTARFFTITAWHDEGSMMVDDGNGGDGPRGPWSVGAAKYTNDVQPRARGRYIHRGKKKAPVALTRLS